MAPSGFLANLQGKSSDISIITEIDTDATCVDVTEELAGQSKLFPQPKMEELEDLLNPSYLPIRLLEPVRWDAVCNLSYGACQKFTAFRSNIAHQYSYNEPSEPDYLFIIFRRLENILFGLPDEYMKLVQSRLANKIQDCETPNRLVVYVLAAFSLGQNEATLDSIRELANEETYDVSLATVASMTRALDKAMRRWPTKAGWAINFVSTLLGEAFDGKGSMFASGKSPNNSREDYWDIYWDIRMDRANHDLARALANLPS